MQTVDFFTPVVDDPATFGAIAAVNALSDLYAMGARPLTALSIAAFPEEDFPLEWAAEIVSGGAARMQESGCALIGGHTVRDPEIKFGYAVTGLVHPDRLLTNDRVRPGDRLILTKALGTGVIATALKAGRAAPEVVAAATESMLRTNAEPSEAAEKYKLRAATDVTGFGLAGHALNLARNSRVTLEISLSRLPLLPGSAALAPDHQAGGLHANRRAYEPHVERRDGDREREWALYDPQTSGGLLLSAPEASAEALLEGLPSARDIGRATAAGTHLLVLTDAATGR